MALQKNVNSYVDVAEAEVYFSDRLGADKWVAATEENKERSLVTATRLLDQLEWLGLPVSAVQPLAFPRSIPSVSEPTPAKFLMAVYELALHLLNNPTLLDETGTVDSLTVGPISLREIQSPGLLPKVVSRLISPYTSSGAVGANRWWRAN